MTRSRAADVADPLAGFPAVLRDLLEAEQSVGNPVAEVGCGFPAPPCGAWARLSRPVSTRPRRSADGLVFSQRPNWPGQGFEWSDGDGAFFVLEPPLPAPPQPGMDEIRAARPVVAGVPLPQPPAPPVPGPGEYCVEIDYRGELVTYREPGRSADVSCTWGPHPVVVRGSLAGWQRLGGGGTAMTAAERQVVLDRVVAHLRRLDLGEVEIVG